jgi:amino acid adenylation domain-containing protein
VQNNRVNPPDSLSLQQTPPAAVHRFFEAQAARSPEICAVTCGQSGLTYGQLNRRANQLARHLQSVGVGPGELAALCLDRSIEAVIGILAILKTGAAYVPLDPAYPAERLAYMLENSGARVLVTNAALWEQEPKVKTPAGLKMVYLQGHGAMDSYDGTNLPDDADEDANASAERLAYVIYTSGSTGQPKGVEMPHRPLVNLLHWQARTCPLATGARVLQFAPLSFDVSFQEIFSTLGEGGTLALISEELRRDPRGLLRFLAESDIARAFLPPIMLHQLAEQQVNSDFAPVSLREIITAGEALRITPAVVRFFSKLNGRCTLHNHYGPSETHVVTAHTLTGAPESWPELPPIGRPIDGVLLELRGENGQPVPDGQPGTLFLGGECLARGYLGAEELTRAKFIIDPQSGARRYCTGDLVKRLPDGELQFLGRADDQVKIRGFRIELGEIEAALSHHPAIEATAVGVSPGAAGSQELIGYLIPRAGQTTPNKPELRRWLSERLPHYMLPTHFVALVKLPLTPSGKVDRRALPRYEAPAAKSGENPPAAPPQTSLEKVIARLWEETLSIRNPGLRDNFFDIGGNSIHAVQVHTRLCQTLQREFPITAIFQHPTIVALAKHLSPAAEASSRLSPMQDRARRQQQAAASAAAASRARSVRKP